MEEEVQTTKKYEGTARQTKQWCGRLVVQLQLLHAAMLVGEVLNGGKMHELMGTPVIRIMRFRPQNI